MKFRAVVSRLAACGSQASQDSKARATSLHDSLIQMPFDGDGKPNRGCQG